MPRQTLKSLRDERDTWQAKYYDLQEKTEKRIAELKNELIEMTGEKNAAQWRFNEAREDWNRLIMMSKGKGEKAENSGDINPIIIMKEPATAQWHPTDFQRLLDTFGRGER